jgi:hypothetical protein
MVFLNATQKIEEKNEKCNKNYYKPAYFRYPFVLILFTTDLIFGDFLQRCKKFTKFKRQLVHSLTNKIY